MRLAFADSLGKIADPKTNNVPVKALLSRQYAKHRASQIDPSAAVLIYQGDTAPYESSETVQFCVIDGEGNGCCFINSNYMGFGTGIVPIGCGFSLQNRGFNFSLDPEHPNCVAGYKKPYHTIIPCLMTHEDDGSLYATLGVMGGFMQPMGHFQVIRNLVDFSMAPQEALDAPRWYINNLGNTQSPHDCKRSSVMLEDGYGGGSDGGNLADRGQMVKTQLEAIGHQVGNLVCGT